MSRLRQWRWTLRTTGRNLWRGRVSALVATGSIALALTLTCLSVLIGEQVGRLRDHWTGKVDITVYLCTRASTSPTCDGATGEKQAQAIGEVITALPGVDAVWFEDRAAAWAAFTKRFSDSEIGSSLTADALPESYRVRLTPGADRAAVRETLAEALVAVGSYETIQDQRQALSGFFRIADRIRLGALLLAVLQTGVSLVLLTHLLRSSIEKRRKDIRVMGLVGAPHRQIRAPFVLEGLLVYLSSVALSAGVVVAGISVVRSAATRLAGVDTLLITPSSASLAILAVGAGGLLVGWSVTRLTLWRRLRQTH